MIEERVRPLLRADGGDLRIDRVGDDGRVYVTLVGRCAGCPGAQYTLKTLVEPAILSVKKVKRVVVLPWQLGPRP